MLEFDDAESLLAVNREATTISIEDPGSIPHKPRRVAREKEDDHSLIGDTDSDQTEVIKINTLVISATHLHMIRHLTVSHLISVANHLLACSSLQVRRKVPPFGLLSITKLFLM